MNAIFYKLGPLINRPGSLRDKTIVPEKRSIIIHSRLIIVYLHIRLPLVLKHSFEIRVFIGAPRTSRTSLDHLNLCLRLYQAWASRCVRLVYLHSKYSICAAGNTCDLLVTLTNTDPQINILSSSTMVVVVWLFPIFLYLSLELRYTIVFSALFSHYSVPLNHLFCTMRGSLSVIIGHWVVLHNRLWALGSCVC